MNFIRELHGCPGLTDFNNNLDVNSVKLCAQKFNLLPISRISSGILKNVHNLQKNKKGGGAIQYYWLHFFLLKSIHDDEVQRMNSTSQKQPSH